MCYNGVTWLSKVCYYVSMADSVYYNMFCIADMLQCHYKRKRKCVPSAVVRPGRFGLDAFAVCGPVVVPRPVAHTQTGAVNN